jgi:hypothetical protein
MEHPDPDVEPKPMEADPTPFEPDLDPQPVEPDPGQLETYGDDGDHEQAVPDW